MQQHAKLGCGLEKEVGWFKSPALHVAAAQCMASWRFMFNYWSSCWCWFSVLLTIIIKTESWRALLLHRQRPFTVLSFSFETAAVCVCGGLTSRSLRSVLLPRTIKGKSDGSRGSPWTRNSFLHASRAPKLAEEVTSNTSKQQWLPLYRGVPKDWNLSVPAVSQIWHMHARTRTHTGSKGKLSGPSAALTPAGGHVGYLQDDRLSIQDGFFTEEVRSHRGPVRVSEAVIDVSVHEGRLSHSEQQTNDNTLTTQHDQVLLNIRSYFGHCGIKTAVHRPAAVKAPKKQESGV